MDPPLTNEASFTAGSNPASYSLVGLLSFPKGSEGGLGLRMRNLSGTGEGFGVGDASVAESTLTDQSGSLGRNGGGGVGKRRMDVGPFHEDESSKLVSTSCSNSDLNEPNGKRMKPSGSRYENGGSKRKAEANSGTGNNGAEEKSKAEPPKDYIHVRARRGQAIDSHSLAERARREKISERMKLLQDLVPGCSSKVIGKALVLDVIINYIQSLQRQVEFLSMKLEAVNTRLNPTIEGFPSKENEPNGKRMKPSGSRDENGGSKRKAEANSGTGNNGTEEKSKAEPPKDYIHVRARRGQATDSHSLAERARREKISERMKILQDLVPGCSKVIGKALVLDKIINYIQSLQCQVEFLSMKLEAVNTRLNPTIEGFPSKELATPTLDVTGMIFGLQAPREYAQGPQVEWLDMQVGNGFERPT